MFMLTYELVPNVTFDGFIPFFRMSGILFPCTCFMRTTQSFVADGGKSESNAQALNSQPSSTVDPVPPSREGGTDINNVS
jgi:hypothetical protein